ncbi:Ubiquitin carboxyl-terminal hydrolase 6 [Diplonema papillatum]|nr:Ubiquitin carboxyl-terminal hydrolase 6 [Diplonema papillatum]
MVKIKIKHEKNKHELDVDPAGGYDAMTKQVEELTGVPCDRQKLILKGKEVKAGDKLDGLLKDNVLLMLLGSAERVPEKPKVLPKFIEDISGDPSAIDVSPAGLKNLGIPAFWLAT